MGTLLSLGFIAIPLSIIATLIRIGMHASNGFNNFREATSTAPKVASFIGDVCTMILVPLLFISVTWNENIVDGAIVSFQGGQQYFWTAWIFVYTVFYFYAINKENPLPPWGEITIGLIIGSGIVLNLLIAWPMQSEDVIWLSILGNLPVILMLLMMFNRRQALLLNNTQHVLDQRRYDNMDVLDYLPGENNRIDSYDYTGAAGEFLRQPPSVKMLAYTVGGGLLILGTVLLTTGFGVEFLVVPE